MATTTTLLNAATTTARGSVATIKGDGVVLASGNFGTGGTVKAQVSPDGGTTWADMKDQNGNVVSFTAAGYANVTLEAPLPVSGVVTAGSGFSISLKFVQ